MEIVAQMGLVIRDVEPSIARIVFVEMTPSAVQRPGIRVVSEWPPLFVWNPVVVRRLQRLIAAKRRTIILVAVTCRAKHASVIRTLLVAACCGTLLV